MHLSRLNTNRTQESVTTRDIMENGVHDNNDTTKRKACDSLKQIDLYGEPVQLTFK